MEGLNKVGQILIEQLEQLRELSELELVKNEPEQVAMISLAMSEIAKTFFTLFV